MHLAADILAIGGAAWLLLLAVFVLRAREALNRLHYVSAATMLGVWPIAVAVILSAQKPGQWLAALLVAVAFSIAGPAVTHISAHAAGREAGLEDDA